MKQKKLSKNGKNKVLAKYKDGNWYEAYIINIYRYHKKTATFYLEWLDGTKNDRIKTYDKIKIIPNNEEYGAGIDYILLASLLF